MTLRSTKAEHHGSHQGPAQAGRHGKSRSADAVTETLQRYADRGVFRGFSVETGRGGRHEYRFSWLTRRPMTLGFDPDVRVLTFKSLFPGVDPRSAMVAQLKALVDARKSRDLPAHKRLDGRRAKAACLVRRGDFSLTLSIRGQYYEYAVQKALNLVNELFLLLHETYPDYLIEHFGLSAE